MAVTRDSLGGTGRSRADVLARSALFTLTPEAFFIDAHGRIATRIVGEVNARDLRAGVNAAGR